MMAEFAPNLDDGELWLPSDIFLNELPRKFHRHQCPCVDDLVQNFGAVSLQYPPKNVSRPPFYSSMNFEGIKCLRPPVRAELVFSNSAWPSGLSRNVHSLYESRTGFNADRPELSCKLLKPAPSQIDNFPEMSRRVLQRQQNRLLNHILPFKGSVFVRASGGTGVFHPRALATAAVAATTFSTSNDFRREHGVRNKHEIQVAHSQRNSILRDCMDDQDQDEGLSLQLHPNMILPRDWNY